MSTENNGLIARLKESIASALKKNFPTIFYKPHMRDDEFELFKKSTADDKNVVEFGAGGSTIYFLKNKKNVYSVENNEGYTNYLKGMNFFNKAIASGKLKFLFIETGKTNGWGKPDNDSLKESWINYATKVWELIPKNAKIDTVFIDGRFRVLTALYSYLQTPPDTKFIIHDFFERSQYKIILDFFETVDSASQLVVLKKRAAADENKIQSLINTYRYDFA